MVKKILLILVLILSMINCEAQITVDRSDMPNTGDTIRWSKTYSMNGLAQRYAGLQDSYPSGQAADCITELGRIRADICRHTFSFPAKINMTRGLIEVVVSTPIGKTHESVFVADVDPITFEAALNLIGCVRSEPYSNFYKNPQKVLKVKHKKKKPDRVEIWVEYKDSLGVQMERIENFIWDEKNNRPLGPVNWHFKGIMRDEMDNPYPYFGNNLVVSYLEADSILEMDSPGLFDDNYFYVNNKRGNFAANKEVIIHVKLVQ